MIQMKDREQTRLRMLFSSMPVEPTVSYIDIIHGVRRIAPPESVWGLARDIRMHLEVEPDSVFFPDEERAIRHGMAQRWVHGVLGSGEHMSPREKAVVSAWEAMQFAGIPPLRREPLEFFSRRYETGEAMYPLSLYGEAKVRDMK